MKTPYILKKYPGLVITSAILLFMACSDKGSSQLQRSLTEFKMYVKEHKESADKYAEEKWDDIDKEYQEKKADLDKQSEKMDKEMKQTYANAVADWEEFKNDMETKHKSQLQEKQTEALRKTLAPEYIKTNMSNITGKNIALVYNHFFGEVEKNKETYTKEEWTAVNDYWNELNDTREKLNAKGAISKEDNREINEIRIKYGATKAMNKPFAEGVKQ